MQSLDQNEPAFVWASCHSIGDDPTDPLVDGGEDLVPDMNWVAAQDILHFRSYP